MLRSIVAMLALFATSSLLLASTTVAAADSAFPNCLVLDKKSGYHLKWHVNTTSSSISFELSQNRNGWLGIGFNVRKQETMGPGDFELGWVASQASGNITSGECVIQDRYLIEGNKLPMMDKVQSITSGACTQTAKKQSFVWSRPLTTNDAQDVDLGAHGTDIELLWAFGATPADSDPQYHGQNRGHLHHVNLFPQKPLSCDTVSKCEHGCAHGVCDNKTAKCMCDAGWYGRACTTHDLAPLQKSLPAGFKVEYYATNVGGARSMTRSKANPKLLYVGTMDMPGSLYAVVGTPGKTKKPLVVTIASNLNEPNGVAWHNGDLYVAEAIRVIRYNDIDGTYTNVGEATIIIPFIPTANNQWHGWKTLKVAPDDSKLYMTVGSPCNFCLKKDGPGDPKTTTKFPFGTITTFGFDGTNFDSIAHGIRNSVGFDWNPVTNKLWFSDNGRDNWGENKPYDELNVVREPNLHFGFPFCYGYGNDTKTGGPDPQFNPSGNCNKFEPARWEIGAHVAPLAIQFYRGGKTPFPATYKNSLFLANHGSWNRSPGTLNGYNIMNFQINEHDQVTKASVFMDGWLEADRNTRWGRPVDIMNLDDGSLLISDDFASAIYRVYRE